MTAHKWTDPVFERALPKSAVSALQGAQFRLVPTDLGPIAKRSIHSEQNEPATQTGS